MSAKKKNEVLTVNLSSDALEKQSEWIAERDALLSKARLVGNVETVEQMEAAGTIQTALGKHLKALNAERMKLTRPLDALKKSFTDQEKEMGSPLDAEQKRLKAMNDALATRLAQEAEAERRRLEEEERKRQQEAAQRQQEAEERRKKAEAIFGEGAAISEPEPEPEPEPVTPPPPPMKLAGNRMVKRWSFEVFDINKVPAKYLILDEKKVRAEIAYAEKMEEEPNIPGLKFTSRMSVEGK